MKVTIPILKRSDPTKVEIYHNGKLNREGMIGADQCEVQLRLPAPLEECDIYFTPCNSHGEPVGPSNIYGEKSSDDSPKECCGNPETCEEP